MFAPPLFGLCSHIGLAVFSRLPAGLLRQDSSDRFRAGSGPISMRFATDLGAEYDRSRAGSGPISATLGRASARILRVRSPSAPSARPLVSCAARVLRIVAHSAASPNIPAGQVRPAPERLRPSAPSCRYVGDMTPSLFSFGRSRRRASDPPAQPEGVAASTPSPPEPSEEPEPPAEPPAPPVSPERRALVENALTAWRYELIDLGGASSLDDISLLDAVVDLTTAHPSGLAQLYAGRPTHLGNLVREREALGQARQSLKDVAGHTDLLARQFGVAPVYLAIGVATWTETVPADEPEPQLSFPFTPRSRGADAAGGSDSDPAGPVSPAAPSPATPASPPSPATPASPASPSSPAAASPASADVGMSASRRAARAAQYDSASSSRMIVRNVNAPVLLRPVRLSSATAEASLTLDPSIEVNPVLIRALHRYGSTTDVEAIAHAALSAEGFTPRAALARIGGLGREYLPGFEMHERLVVGAFVHPGQALVEDFDATIERARTSALVAALAGDEIAREALDVELPASRAEDRAPEA